MKSPFFSIIVPVYNVEKYLSQCINSVLNQSFQDYELILVEDGSPDHCAEICDEFAQNYSKIKVIHKENGGLSSARNAGLDMARGRYIIFLDSDDFWDYNEALMDIHANLFESDADLLLFPAKRFFEKNQKVTYILNMEVDRYKIFTDNTNSAINYLLENNIFRAAAWNKVVKRIIIEEYHMRFKEGVLSEDMDWCGDLLINCKKYDFYNNAFYCYRQQRTGSITSEKNEKLIQDKLYMIEKGYKQAIQLEKPQKEYLASYYAYEYSVTLGVSSGVKNKILLKKMKELHIILENNICKKVDVVRKLKKIVGYELTRKILVLFVKIK